MPKPLTQENCKATMAADHPQIPAGTVDTAKLAALLLELNISRRHCRAYPKEHPVVTASLNRVVAVYAELLQSHGELVIGVTREALLVDGVTLEKSNRVFRDFAKSLFERGIGALAFAPGLDAEELRNFNTVLSLRREDIQRHGGIEQVWGRAGLKSLSMRPIRYDMFAATDEDTIRSTPQSSAVESMWERFARELVLGDPGMIEVEGIDPELLAAVLNKRAQGGDEITDYGRVMADFIAHADLLQDMGGDEVQPYQKLANFVGRLNPELRRQFMQSSFNVKNASGELAAQKIIPHLPADAVIETLEEVNSSRTSVPPVILGLMQKLVQHGGGAARNTVDGAGENADEVGRKVRTIFREHAAEEFIPDAYQQKLNRIMSLDQLPAVSGVDFSELLQTLDPQTVEAGISDIMLQLIMLEPVGDGPDPLLGNLGEMCSSFLETGQYEQLLRIIRLADDGRLADGSRGMLHDFFTSREFLYEVLNGLHIWGKARFGEIRKLIGAIGTPFIEVLLDRLAEEGGLSLRRFMIDCLIEIGPAAREAILQRLSDERWYFQRNLLIMLRSMEDSSGLEQVRPLAASDNQRVRHEALKTLLHFNDRAAEGRLLLEMDSANSEVRMSAVRMAEHSRSAEAFRKLLAMVTNGGYSESEVDLKCAAVKVLGEIGRAEALPELARVLGAKSLLGAKQLNRLKAAVVASLEKYPPEIARQVLGRLAGGSDDVARQAADSLRRLGAVQS